MLHKTVQPPTPAVGINVQGAGVVSGTMPSAAGEGVAAVSLAVEGEGVGSMLAVDGVSVADHGTAVECSRIQCDTPVGNGTVAWRVVVPIARHEWTEN